jgi:undecaprenyl-diphosphatase
VITGFLLAIGLLLTHVLDGSVGRWDNHVNRWFVTQRTGWANGVSSVASFMLDTVPVVAVAACAVLILVLLHHRRAALVLVFGLGLEITVFLSVTYPVARPRPDVPRLSSTPSTSSFPSGHTAAAVVLYGGIALVIHYLSRRRPVRVAAWGVAVSIVLIVAVSRVYRGMHHPSDVMIGAVYGAGCLWVAVLAVRAIPAHEPSLEAHDARRAAPDSEPTPRDRRAAEWEVVA